MTRSGERRQPTLPLRWSIAVTVTALAASSAIVKAAGGPQRATPVGPVVVTRVATPERALQFDVTVPGGLDDVWAAFSTTEGLSTWLWRDTRVDLRPGGDWLALYGPGTGGGTILSFVPKLQLVLSAMAPEQFPTVRATRTKAVFDFRAVTAHSTHVRLTQTGWQTGPEWDKAYDYLADGNAQLLEQLYQRFVTGPIQWPKGRERTHRCSPDTEAPVEWVDGRQARGE